MIQHRHFVTAEQSRARIFSDILDVEFEEDGIPVSLYEVDEANNIWGVAIYVGEDNSSTDKARMHSALDRTGTPFEIQTQIIEQTDWVAKTLRQLSPVRAGRFIIHGSHDPDAARFNDIAVEIDAGLAFGTGHHGTTAGCLDMLEMQLKSRSFHNPLDLGTGSGVLAIAFAKAARTKILASDIDPVSSRVARDNAKTNAVAKLVKCIAATGFNHNEIRKRAPFDLVIANILARPLQMLARDFSKNLAPEATVILSGLLPHQKARIIAAYKIQGFKFIRSHIRDGWLTLILRNQ